jgi:hypothetical protein
VKEVKGINVRGTREDYKQSLPMRGNPGRRKVLDNTEFELRLSAGIGIGLVQN